MPLHRLHLLALFLVLATPALSCNSEDPAGPSSGALKVVITTGGVEPDPDGYMLRLDADESRAVGTTGNVAWIDLTPANHTLSLEGVATNCDVAGENPRTVSVKAGETTPVDFHVTCTEVPRILFMSYREGSYGIYTTNLDGSVQTNLTPDVSVDPDSRPAWSPDGSRIAFLSAPASLGGRGDLYVMNADGTGKTKLIPFEREVLTFSWAPDGGRLAFSSPSMGGAYTFIINVDGTGERMLTNGLAPVWSPDGSRIAFIAFGDGGISIINSDGTGRTGITNPESATDLAPKWSPDGASIAFIRTSATPPGDGVEHSLWLMNADGSNPRPLTHVLQGPISDPTWSHDGRTLAFSWVGEIYLINPDGTGLMNLTNTAFLFEVNLDWSSDDSRLVFSRWSNLNDGDIWVMARDGSQVSNVSQNPGWIAGPGWRPGY
jgi:Tol biopolymer transport system component